MKVKLVKEFLYEKFTKDSDPIYDLTIGMKAKLDKFIKKHSIDIDTYKERNTHGVPIKDIYLLVCVDRKKYDLVKYLLDCGANVHTDAGVFGKDCDLPIRFSIFNSDYKMFKILLDYGANVLKCFNKDEIQLLHLDSMSSIKAIVKENSKIYSEIKKIIDKYYAKRKNYKRYKKIR